jgi:hypothetical protein
MWSTYPGIIFQEHNPTKMNTTKNNIAPPFHRFIGNLEHINIYEYEATLSAGHDQLEELKRQ